MKVIYKKNGTFELIINSEVMNVPDDMSNRHRQMISDWEAEGNEIEIEEIPSEPEYSYKLFKSTFINRLTNEEAEIMETTLASADAKLRLLFNSIEYFKSDDPLFQVLNGAVASALGQERADILLSEGDE